MAMMISKFHRLIQSKILWGIFAVVISIAMVGLFSDMPDIQQANAEASSVGTLNGEPVQYNEFQSAYANTRLQAALSFGQSLPRTEEVETRLRELAWKRVITLRKIRQLNIQVSDAEVLAGIQQQGMFRNQNGQFDTRTYAVFLNRFLVEQMGIGQKQFEAYMREELAIMKFSQFVAQSILIAPAELRRAYETVTDRLTLDLIEISPDRVTERTATPEEAEEYYRANLESFREPEKMIVKFASFSVTNAMNGVNVSEEEILAYYNENINQYVIEPEEPKEASPDLATKASPLSEEGSVPEESSAENNATPENVSTPGPEISGEEPPPSASENELSPSPADLASESEVDVLDLTLPENLEPESAEGFDAETPEIISEPAVQYAEFETVKEDIAKLLRRQKARLAAGEAATDFVLAVQDAAYQGESFTQYAEKEGIEIQTTAPFAKNELPKGIDSGSSFSREAFDLGSSLTDSFSDPVDGKDTIYVLSAQERIPSSIPDFEEVKADAVVFASREKSAEALVEFAEALKKEIIDQLSSGEVFSDLVKTKGYEVTSLEEITAASGIPDSPYQDILFRGILSRNEGELTDLLPAGDQILLAYIRKRTPAPAQSFTDYRPRIISNLVGERSPRIFNAFQDYLLDKAAFSEKTIEDENPDQDSSSNSSAS